MECPIGVIGERPPLVFHLAVWILLSSSKMDVRVRLVSQLLPRAQRLFVGGMSDGDSSRVCVRSGHGGGSNRGRSASGIWAS